MANKKTHLDDCICKLQFSGLCGYNIRKALRSNGIYTIRHLVTKKEEELTQMKGISQKNIIRLSSTLQKEGLHFDMSEEDLLRYEEK